MRRALLQNRWIALLLTALVMTLPLRAFPAHSKHEVHDQIMALEAQWRQAQLTGDVAAMDKLLSDDYLGVTSAGEVVTKAQQLDRMRARKIVLTRLDTSDIKIKMLGRSVAVVNSLATVEGTNNGRAINGSFRYTRVYQRLPNGSWKITSFEPTRIPRRHHHDGAGSDQANPPPGVPPQ